MSALDEVCKPYYLADMVAQSHLSQHDADKIYADAAKELAELRSENERLTKENIQFKDAGTFALTILKSIRSDHYSAISDANNDSITMFLQKYEKDTK